MLLFIARHGDYVQESIDPQKPLSEKGKEDVARVANAIKEQGFSADVFIHSTKTRAKQTAEIFRRIINPKGNIAARENMSPNDSIERLASEIPSWENNTMLVGHAPFMPMLASSLLESESEASFRMKTSSVVILGKKDQQWEMISYLTPENINS